MALHQGLAEDGIKQIGIAIRAAEAAERAAAVAERTLVDAELPYVFVFGVAKFKYAPNSEMGQSAFVEYTIANYGRTPAIIEEARADFLVPSVGTADDVTTVYEDNPLFVLPILAPGQKLPSIQHHRWRIRNVNDLDGMYQLKFNMTADEDGTIEVTPLLGKRRICTLE